MGKCVCAKERVNEKTGERGSWSTLEMGESHAALIHTLYEFGVTLALQNTLQPLVSHHFIMWIHVGAPLCKHCIWLHIDCRCSTPHSLKTRHAIQTFMYTKSWLVCQLYFAFSSSTNTVHTKNLCFFAKELSFDFHILGAFRLILSQIN